jgi:hypothetical protein
VLSLKETLSGIIYTVLFFLGVLTIFLTFYYRLRKTGNAQNRKWDDFFEEERIASSTTKREKVPSSLLWTINIAAIPFVTDKNCEEIYEKLKLFIDLPLADLRAYSNIELKKKFGMNHLNELIVCEQRYLQCMKLLTEYGIALKNEGFLQESKQVLLYALEKRCDIKSCYLSLIEIYAIMQDKEALKELKSITNRSKDDLVYYEKIMETLDEAYKKLV